jgi:transcriptional regulator EpsA
VHTRAHFFKWTQGLLQSLLAHEALLCVVHGADARTPRVDCFGTAARSGALGELFQRGAAAAPGLLGEWRERGGLPVACTVRQGAALCGEEFARELERLDATELIAHGVGDPDGHAGGFFVFCCRPGTPGPNAGYLVQLALPALHAAWARAQLDAHGAGGARGTGVDAGVLTPREQEILRWIAIGKSNFEVGAILSISPLTVKNHVQKILRNLNVVNRTQAVGKALEARIISP